MSNVSRFITDTFEPCKPLLESSNLSMEGACSQIMWEKMHMPLLVSSGLSSAQDIDLDQVGLATSTMLMALGILVIHEVTVTSFQNLTEKHPGSISVITGEVVKEDIVVVPGKCGPLVLQWLDEDLPFFPRGVLILSGVAISFCLGQVESILQVVEERRRYEVLVDFAVLLSGAELKTSNGMCGYVDVPFNIEPPDEGQHVLVDKDVVVARGAFRVG